MKLAAYILIGAILIIALLCAQVASRRRSALRYCDTACKALMESTIGTIKQDVTRARIAQKRLKEAGLYDEADNLGAFTARVRRRVYADRDWATKKMRDLSRQFRSDCD